MPDDLLGWLGFHTQELVAGFAGGVVNAFVFKRSRPLAVVTSIVVGGLAANYLGALMSAALTKAFSVLSIAISENTGSFVVGVAGMAICQGIAESANSWSPFKGSRK